MAEPYRAHAVIEAPVEDVWAIVSDPRTHPEWWPDLRAVRMSEPLTEGGEYTRTERRLGFLDLVDAVWVAERLQDLQEAHFRCTVSGTYMKFALTPADRDTFVEVESGMLPTNRRWQAVQLISGPLLRGWTRDVLDALPPVVARLRKTPQPS